MASLGRILWRWTAGVFAVLAIALALLFGIFRIAVSHAPEYRAPIEARVSEAIGLPLRIGQLDARLGLDGPEVVVNDVSVLSEDGRTPLLEAARASISLDVSQLVLRWRIAWDAVTVDGIQLDVLRESDGSVRILGRGLDEFPKRDPNRPFPVAELRVRESRVIVTDRAGAGDGGSEVVWDLDSVNLSLIDRRDGIRISGDFLLPPGAGERVAFWANQLDGDDRWRAHAASQAVDFSALGRIPELSGIVPAGGTAELRAWLDGSGARPTAASVEFDLADVVLPPVPAPAAQADPGTAAVAYERLAGRLEWDRTEDGWKARIENLDLQRRDSAWRASKVTAGSRLERLTGRRQTVVTADYLRLGDLQPLVTRLPDEGLRARIAALAPTGEVRALEVEVESTPGGAVADAEVTVQADLREVSIRPDGAVPGITGLSGKLRSDARGGRFELDGGALGLEFPRLFREPLAMTRAEGLLLWNRGSEGLNLLGDGVALSTADLNLETGFRIRLADDEQPGFIDLRGELTDFDVTRTSPYLPVGIMSPKLVGWLDKALIGGRVDSAAVRIEGPLRGFPYRDDQGEFEVAFTATELDMDYTAGWPVAEDMTADIRFENEGMTAVIREGRLQGLDVGTIRAGFADLKSGELTLAGDLSGPFPNVHAYLVNSPAIRGALDPALSELVVEAGDAVVEADMLLPLKDLPSRRVDVDARIEGGSLRYAKVLDSVTDLDGTISVRGAEVFGEGLTGRLLGQPVRIDIAPYEDQGVRARFDIQTTADALIQGLNLPLSRYVSGNTRLTGFLQFPAPGSGKRFWMRYESDTVGLALSLPAPLAKPADEAAPFVFECRFPEDGQQDWYMQLGEGMSARMTLLAEDNRLRFIRATVQGGSLDARHHQGTGLLVRGHFDSVSVDEWLGVDFSTADAAAEGTPFEDFFNGVDVHVDELEIMGQHVAGASVAMSRAADTWRITVDSETMDGEITVPFDLASRRAPIVIDMERLTMFDGERDGGGEAVDPGTVPPLEIRARSLRSHGINLGNFEASLRPLPAGFEVPGFTARGPSFEITGNMRSELGPAVDRTTLSVDVTSTDLAGTLEFAGFAPAVDSDDARFTTELSWQGGLVPDVLAVAQGTARLRLGSGSLTEVKPGAGRVFGLLSVQALPRRLMLDFRDVFKKGFFFDEFGGDFQVANGLARTENLKMKGRAADIGIIGTVDLVGREYDQTAVVSAQIGNTLPVVGAIAAGPIIGGGLFVLKEILKEPLREAGQVQYRITGPWENPVVAKVTGDNRSGTQVSRSDDEPGSGGG